MFVSTTAPCDSSVEITPSSLLRYFYRHLSAPVVLVFVLFIAFFQPIAMRGQATQLSVIDEYLQVVKDPTNSGTEFTVFPEHTEAYNKIREAMGKPNTILRPANFTNGDLIAAQNQLMNDRNITFDPVYKDIFTELKNWLVLKQDVINYFYDLEHLLGDLQQRQSQSVDVVYDLLSLEYPPETKAETTLGDVYGTMLLDAASAVGGLVGPVATLTSLITMCINAAEGVDKLMAEHNAGQPPPPLALDKVLLQQQIQNNFQAIKERSAEILDRILMDQKLLNRFGRLARIGSTKQSYVLHEYARAFEKELWLTVLAQQADWKTVLMAPKQLDFTCAKGGLIECGPEAERHADATFSKDPSVFAVAFVEREKCLNRPKSGNCLSWGNRYLEAYTLTIGRQKLDGQPTALAKATLTQMLSTGVTRRELEKLAFAKKVDDFSFYPSVDGHNARSTENMEVFLDAIHGDFVKYASPDEVVTHLQSGHSPALAVYRPPGHINEQLFIAYHTAPTPFDISITHSEDGVQWSVPKGTYKFYHPQPAHVPLTGPALLVSDKRLLIAYGSAQSDRPIYGRYIDMSDYSELKKSDQTRLTFLTEERAKWLESHPSVLGWPDVKEWVSLNNDLASADYTALRSWDIEQAPQHIFFADTKIPSDGGKYEMYRKRLGPIISKTTALTDVAVALSETPLAHEGPMQTSNAAIMAYKKSDSNTIHWIQGSFEEFGFPDNRILAHSLDAPAVAPHPRDHVLFAYRTDQDHTKRQSSHIRYFTLMDAMSGKITEDQHPQIDLAYPEEPASGPSMIYDKKRGLYFLAFADKHKQVYIYQKSPNESHWSRLVKLDNESVERPALTIFRNKLYLAVRRETGQLVIAPVLHTLGPKLAFLMADDPRYSDVNGVTPIAEEVLWERNNHDYDPVSYGFTGWKYGESNFGPSSTTAWYTAVNDQHMAINRALETLATPTIPLPKNDDGAPAPILKFRHWIRSSPGETGNGGSVRLEILGATGWTNQDVLPMKVLDDTAHLNSMTKLLTDSEGAWQDIEVALPTTLYGSSFRVVFEFKDVGDGITQNGWVIDGITVYIPE